MSETEALPTHEIVQPNDRALILDFGAQYRDLIYWEIVEQGIRADIVPVTANTQLDIESITSNYKAVVLSGSNKSVNDADAPTIPTELLDGRIPTMGICYGGQLIAKTLGGEVGKKEEDGHHLGEYGATDITIDPDSVAFSGLGRVTKALMSHGDSILELPPGFRQIGDSRGIVAAFESQDGRVFGTQFHPEVNDTEQGVDMFRQFLQETANIAPDPHYTEEVALGEYLHKEEAKIADILESGGEITGLISGGVDSSVVAMMAKTVAERLGRLDQLTFYFIDNGLMRTEDEEVVDMLGRSGIPVQKVDASDHFFHERITLIDKETGEEYLAGPLISEADPQLKRRLIGKAFIDISEGIMAQRRTERSATQYLLQGTNAADFVESGAHGGDVIKHHHNVTPETDAMRTSGQILEPLLGLFKHHVRSSAREMYGLPEELSDRQPFPGPGLGPRIVANPEGTLNKPENFEQLQDRLDTLLGDEVSGHIVCLNTVGNKGDGRSLTNLVVLEGAAPWDRLDELSQQITDKFSDVNRVLYAPGVTIDRARVGGVITDVTPQIAKNLRRMEEIKRSAMHREDLDPYISQHFVATLGFDLLGTGQPTLALRLFITGDKLAEMAHRRGKGSKEDYMTGIAAVPGVHIDQAGFDRVMADLDQSLRDHGTLVYDLTGKPPGTTEYE